MQNIMKTFVLLTILSVVHILPDASASKIKRMNAHQAREAVDNRLAQTSITKQLGNQKQPVPMASSLEENVLTMTPGKATKTVEVLGYTIGSYMQDEVDKIAFIKKGNEPIVIVTQKLYTQLYNEATPETKRILSENHIEGGEE